MSDLIKFTHAEEGVLSSDGSTGLGYVAVITSLARTSKLHYPKDSDPIRIYATDEQGLDHAVNYSYQATSHIQDSITAVSSIIALCENKEDIAEYLDSAMWLITGLSELSNEINSIAGDMQYAQAQQKNQA